MRCRVGGHRQRAVDGDAPVEEQRVVELAQPACVPPVDTPGDAERTAGRVRVVALPVDAVALVVVGSAAACCVRRAFECAQLAPRSAAARTNATKRRCDAPVALMPPLALVVGTAGTSMTLHRQRTASSTWTADTSSGSGSF